MINERIIGTNTGADTIVPSENFNTVLYTGTGATQRIGGYINRGFISKGTGIAGVEIPNVENLFNKKNTEHSVSLWFNGNPTQYAGEIFSDYATQSFTVFLNVNPSGYLQGSVRMNSTEVYITSSTTVNDGNWHHVVYTYKNSTSTIKMYLDGSLVGSGTIPSSSYYSNSGTNIKITAGAVYYPPSSSYSHGIIGVIDQLRIFNREVVLSEVTTLYGETHASTTKSTTDIFDDGSGVALYQFDGNANDTGGANGATKAIDTTDKAASFNGSNTGIEFVGINSGLSGSPLSVSFWVKTTQSAYSYLFSSTGLSANNQPAIELRTDGTFQFYYYSGGSTAFVGVSTSAINDGNWHHVVCKWDGTTATNGAQIWVDGSLETQMTASVAASSITLSTQIGIGKAQTRSVGYFNGLIDEVRIYTSALNQNNITSLYNLSGEPTANLIGYYTLDGNSNDTSGSYTTYNGADSNITYVQSTKKGTERIDSGAAAIFNGTNASLDIESSDLIQNNIESFSFWFKNKFMLGFYDPSGASSSDRRRWFIDNNTNGSIKIQVNNDQYNYQQTGITEDSNWHHLAVLSNGYIYLDGTALSSQFSTSYWITNGTNGTSRDTIRIGTSDYIGAANSSYVAGSIDDLRFYSDVLTSTEVGYIYSNTTASIPTDNLAAHYKLDGNALDETAGYDGTESNITYGYDGTGSVSYQEATHFQPDLVWIKKRSSSTSSDHILTDSVRGESRFLYPNLALTESAAGGSGTIYFNGFDSNGFTVGSSTYVGGNNETYVAWCWNAGDGSSASNTDGSITSTVKANTEAGFSIVKYTGNSTAGATVGHGLSSAPDLIIAKGLETASAYNWMVYASAATTSLGKTAEHGHAYLNLTNVYEEPVDQNIKSIWNDTAPTPTVFSISDNVNINANGAYIAYCFHSVTGYQKIGSYSGTGVASGNIIETGFEPAFLLIKRTDSTGFWVLHDNKRDAVNPRNAALYANVANAESTAQAVNFLSNGFQPVTTDSDVNASGTYIYLAIAADPDTTTPTVADSFDVVTYTGNGSANHKINTDFKPDFVWIKDRGVNGANHVLSDSVRGPGKFVISNLTNSEYTSAGGTLSSFDEDGFTLAAASPAYDFNINSNSYVAWCWKAGDHDDNLPEINTNGSIDTIVSVNDEAGFSIVKYTGTGATATIGHGLSAAPELIIAKNLDSAQSWIVNADAIGKSNILTLNTNGGQLSRPNQYYYDWDATTISVASDVHTNGNGNEIIAYCWKSITGYSKIGSYTPVAGDDEINIGFRPDLVVVKRSDSTGNWEVHDSTRWSTINNENGESRRLRWNDSSAEAQFTNSPIFFTDTGFTLDSSVSGDNYGDYDTTGGTYIYMAFKKN